VALKLAQALSEDSDFIHSLLDLAAIGTSADVVSVLGENRLILDRGLKLIYEGSRPGILALKEASGFKNGFFKNSLLHFGLNPRINAPGRIDDSNEVIKLFSTQSHKEAQIIAKWMCDLNTKRQQIEEIVLRQATEQVQSKDGLGSAIVVASENWHLGVVGIVASRLVDTYGVPSFVFTIDNGIAKGSARSNGAFDILEGLKKCSHLIERFGGHKQAAGLSVKESLLNEFRQAIREIVSDSVSTDTTPTIFVDALLEFSDLTHDLVREMSVLEPFGYCNNEPTFGSKLLEVLDTRVVGNNHLLMNLRQKGKVINAIGFYMGDLAERVSNTFVDVLYMPSIKKQNNNTLQLQIKAIRHSS
ncbi:MAG: DHH family phosphoesterase, partial [Thermodesulfovibrionales bacterium]|nr:DHH family phosphoesterase [Thermodesulfovibrionales bacterium]